MNVKKSCALLAGALLLWVAPALAQSSMGGVDGTVTDTTGGVLPGATVTLVSQDTGIQMVRHTNERGFFSFVNLRPGSYAITVELEGLKTAKVAAFDVGVNETVTRNVRLEVGQLTDVVQVTAQSELIQTSTAALGHVVQERVIRSLPLQGRNFTSLLLLEPGVNPVSTAQGPSSETSLTNVEGNSGMPGGAIINASIQGQQNRSKVYYMDGIINSSVRGGTYVALPDIDSLQEFKVQSQSDKAEFGGVTGGVVNITSKSGGNQFRGSAFGFFRNERFNARNPFRDADVKRPPDFRQSQFGANLGGPIVKNRTFFFASYDGWRYRDFAAIRQTVPAGSELDGDFSHAVGGRIIYNPFTTRVVKGKIVRDPFPGNIIPKNLISPTMQAFLKAYMVKPNVPGNVTDNYLASRAEKGDSNAFQARIDHHFSTSDNIFFRWTERHIDSYVPRGDLGFQTPWSTNRNFGGGWFHSFSNNIILETRGGLATQPTEDPPYKHPLGIEPQKGLALPELDRFQGYIVTGLGSPWSIPTLGVQGPRERQNPNWNISADLTWLKSNHNFKGGFQMLRIGRLQKNQFGEIIFSAEATRDPQNTSRTGDPLASALLGLPGQIRGYVPDLGYIDFHTATLSGYVQDQWAMKPNFTLTYGVRYDYITPSVGDYGLQSGPDMNTGQWLLALNQMPGVCTPNDPPPCLPAPLDQIPYNQYITTTGSPNSIIKPIKDNVGPRVGAAWEINPRTVLRTGYSLMWDALVSRSQYSQHQFESWGWPQFSGIDTGAINREGGAIQRLEDWSTLPFAAPRAAPWNSTGYFNDPGRKDGYSHQWHVELQRELRANLMVAAAYVGSYNGRMEYSGYAAAPKTPAFDASGRKLTVAERNQLRPWPHIDGTFRYSNDIGMSKYNSAQVRLQRRFADGISSTFSYTYSRTIDTSSGWFAAENGIGGGAVVQNYWDIANARGISSYDIPHLVTWGTVLELPVGRGKRWLSGGGLPSAILGNWQLNWMLLARSGQPFTPTVGGDPANIGVNGYARPDIVGDPEVSDPTTAQWFNPAAFAPPVGSFGNAAKNILRAPGFWNVDLGLQRNVGIGSGRNLELRVEAFNVFNHINLGNPNVAIDNPSAGRITSMSGRPRQIQFGLRLTY